MSPQSERPLKAAYKVVLDPHGYPFVRPMGEVLPQGWHEVGVKGDQEECLSFVHELEVEASPPFPLPLSEDELYSD